MIQHDLTHDPMVQHISQTHHDTPTRFRTQRPSLRIALWQEGRHFAVYTQNIHGKAGPVLVARLKMDLRSHNRLAFTGQVPASHHGSTLSLKTNYYTEKQPNLASHATTLVG